MAYVIPAGGILEIQLRGVLHGQRTINTFHYQTPDSVPDGDAALVTVLASWETLNWDDIRAGMSNEFQDVTLSGQWVYPVRYVNRVLVPANTTGALASVSEPSGVSLVIRRKTVQAGRKYRGRVYMPGITKADTSGSKIGNAWYLAYASDFEDMVLSQPLIGITEIVHPVIWSYKAPTRATRVVAAEVDRDLRYQRRREIGKGV